ncbi:hypothetical protein [Rhodoligotrophos defluvii]|uniref:hypothetical protein n=1 Tax=Rhodoligotrophos defluvii TaxID=2561934 RepID=UPI0010C99EB7|nr:hypothetical protein [Rhodoligotrophos defluvii]
MSQDYDNTPPRTPTPRGSSNLLILLGALIVAVAALAYFVFGTDEVGNQSAETGTGTTTEQMENRAEAPETSPAPTSPAPGSPAPAQGQAQ